MALIRTFGWQWLWWQISCVWQELVLKMAQPVLLGYVILYFSDATFDPQYAIMAAVGVCLCSVLNVISYHPFVMETMYVSRLSCARSKPSTTVAGTSACG